MKTLLKRSLAFIMSAVLLAGAVSLAGTAYGEDTEVSVLYGDANSDGSVNVKDAILMLKDIAQWPDLGIDLASADITQNGRIDVRDVMVILRSIANGDESINVVAGEAHSLKDAYVIVDDNTYYGMKLGITSGWRLDNRGGEPCDFSSEVVGRLNDISTVNGCAMIRDINLTTEGKLLLETSAAISGDGFAMEFRNHADECIYRLFSDEGVWKVGLPNGAVRTTDATAVYSLYRFCITVDLDNGVAFTTVNDVDLGSTELMLSGERANVMSFRFATSEEETPVVTLGTVRITANYALSADFNHYLQGELRHGWESDGAIVTGSTLTLNEGAARKTFDGVGGTVLADTEVFVGAGRDMSFAIGCNEREIVRVYTDDNTLYANGEAVYDGYLSDMWYRLRIEADTDRDTARIHLNGREIATVPFTAYTNCIDTVFLSSRGGEAVFGRINVWEKQYHEDYVPAPVRPEGEEKYNVGINACSLWREGTHYGWGTVTPYTDIEPVLGYYDEGSPETADWEIKYMVEHGIDFQAFCWYATVPSGPMRADKLATHLHDGYMYAEYSSEMKYCILWEAMNGARPADVDAWKESYVPYFIENYFKDSRYMTIDNQLVFLIFGSNYLLNQYGAQTVSEMFDYMEEEVVKLGYDGVIYVASNSVPDSSNESMGFDASCAYNWGQSGSDAYQSKMAIITHADNDSVYNVPTASVGFNSVGWFGERFPMMSKDGFYEVNEWIRKTYLKKYAKKGTWQENFVMLSTWNEYGEGTYIMPSAGNGFDYLDVIRDVYTDAEADEGLNVIPTEAQRARVTRMYPQHRRVLREEGYLTEDTGEITSIVINDKSVDLLLYGEKRDGRVFIPFDPKVGLDYRLHIFHTWDKAERRLTLEFAEHKAVFTVGKDTFLFDGEERSLGYTLWDKDSLPMLDLEALCALVGYDYAVKDGAICIATDQYGYVVDIKDHFEFDRNGDVEGWSSSKMALSVSDGALHSVTSQETNDPIISYQGNVDLKAEDYEYLEVRCRYKYDSESLQSLVLYYTTDWASTMSESLTVKAQLSSKDSNGEWEVYTVSLSSIENWRGTIRKIRFDPFNAMGEMDIDYIRFIPREG